MQQSHNGPFTWLHTWPGPSSSDPLEYSRAGNSARYSSIQALVWRSRALYCNVIQVKERSNELEYCGLAVGLSFVYAQEKVQEDVRRRPISFGKHLRCVAVLPANSLVFLMGPMEKGSCETICAWLALRQLLLFLLVRSAKSKS